ncbi:acetoin utilization protein AcuB [Bacillus sp. AFS001701]|uniref:acetoin utilization AcuB family protein n=1 Tax=Bacillaceae TaxID=186817 RepID=UPI000BF35526|nr:acetoin utilization AcuB family protein [Bacillus sp. AFS001701]PET56551.1 acetoin utilization protein AcuB [Bacillus sp. AFS001701]
MLIQDIMRSSNITLKKENTIGEAVTIFRTGDVRHIPIINEDNQVVGIISDRDVRDALPSTLFPQAFSSVLEVPVEKIMTTNVITCSSIDFVEEVATYFYQYKIGCLPVVSSEKLIGLVTEIDVLHTLVTLTGAYQPSSQIEILVHDHPGILSDVVNVFSKENINIVSVLVYPAKEVDHKVLVFRIQTMNPLSIIRTLKTEGYKILWPNEASES